MNWQIIFTILLNISGWYVVHILSDRRDRKKEWREFARSTALIVDAIEKNALCYHTATDRNITLEWEIINLITKLDTQIQLSKKHLILPCDTSFFRAAVTLDNFQTSDFIQQVHHSKIVQSISWHATQLQEYLFNAE